MKILIKERNDTEKRSWVKAFSSLGIKTAVWNGGTSAFDTFDSFEPTIFICNAEHLNIDIVKCLNQRPYLKTLINVRPNSTKDIIPTNSNMPVASDLELKLIDQITCDKFLYTSNRNNSLFDYEDLYTINNSADIFLQYTPSIKSDIVYVGDYDNNILNMTLLKLCFDFKYNIKIFGNTKWPVCQYCGVCPDVMSVKSGARINLNFGKDYEILHGFDAPTDLYTNYFYKFFTISTQYSDFPTTSFHTISDFFDMIDRFMNHVEHTYDIIDSHYNYALNNTSLHRVSYILQIMGEYNCQQQITEYLKKYY